MGLMDEEDLEDLRKARRRRMRKVSLFVDEAASREPQKVAGHCNLDPVSQCFLCPFQRLDDEDYDEDQAEEDVSSLRIILKKKDNKKNQNVLANCEPVFCIMKCI